MLNILTTLILINIIAEFESANPYRGLFAVDSWIFTQPVLQINYLSNQKIIVRTKQRIFISNISNPMTSIRNITTQGDNSFNVSASLVSQTFIYIKHNSIIGDNSEGPIDITTIDNATSSSLYKHQDLLIFNDKNRTLYCLNQTSNIITKGPIFANLNDILSTEILYSANLDKIIYYTSPYILITDPLFQNNHVIKLTNYHSSYQLKISEGGGVFALITDINIQIFVWDPQIRQYFGNIFSSQFQLMRLKLLFLDFNRCQYNFLLVDSDGLHNVIASYNYSAALQYSISSKINQKFVQLSGNKSLVYTIDVAGQVYSQLRVGNINSKLTFWMVWSISDFGIPASTKVQNLLVSEGGHLLIGIIHQNNSQFMKIWRITKPFKQICQIQTNQISTLKGVQGQYQIDLDWLMLVSDTKISLFNLTVCQSIKQMEIKIQTYIISFDNSIVLVVNQKQEFIQIDVLTLEPIQPIIKLNTIQHIFIKNQLKGQIILIGLRPNNVKRAQIFKYDKNGQIVKQITISICLFQQSFMWAGIDYFKLICKLSSNQNYHLVTILNATNLKILQQYSTSNLDVSNSDCTDNYQINFRYKSLYYAQGTYSNLNYFNYSKSNTMNQYISFVKNQSDLVLIQTDIDYNKYLTIYDISKFQINKKRMIKIQNKQIFAIQDFYLSEDGNYIVKKNHLYIAGYETNITVYEVDSLNVVLTLVCNSTKDYTIQSPPIFIDLLGYLYISISSNTIRQYDFKTIKIHYFPKSQNIQGVISLSNYGETYMVSVMKDNGTLEIQHWNKYPLSLIASYKAPANGSITEIKFSLNDNQVILIQNESLYWLYYSFHFLNNNTKTCDFVANHMLLCLSNSNKLYFVSISSFQWTFLLDNIFIMAINPSRSRVLLITNNSLQVANIYENQIEVIQTAQSLQQNISSAIFLQNGSIITVSQKQNRVSLWTFIECSSDKYLHNNVCICPNYSKPNLQGTCVCDIMRVMNNHQCNCIPNSMDLAGKCLCDEARQFKQSACICVANSILKDGRCQCLQPRIFSNGQCNCKDSFTQLDGKCVCRQDQFLSNESCHDCQYFCKTCTEEANNCDNLNQIGYLIISGITLAVIGVFALVVVIIRKCILMGLKKKVSLMESQSGIQA